MAGPSGQPQLFCAILGFVLHDSFIMIKNVTNIAKIMSKPRPSRAATRDSHDESRDNSQPYHWFKLFSILAADWSEKRSGKDFLRTL